MTSPTVAPDNDDRDWVTHTVADAAQYERRRAHNNGEDPRRIERGGREITSDDWDPR